MLLFVVIQLCMFMSLLFHPRVLGWILTQLWKIVTFGRKEALGELSIKGVYIFSLTFFGCTLNLSGVQLSIEWAGIRIKLWEILSPCEIWFDGVSVIEVKDEEREQLPWCIPQGKGEDKPPTHHDSLHEGPDKLFVLPGYIIWLLTTVKIAISHLVLEAGGHKVDVTHANLSANFATKLNSVVSVISLDKVKFQDTAIGLHGTFAGFIFKSATVMRRHVEHLFLQQHLNSRELLSEDLDDGQESYSIFTPMEITRVISVSTVFTSLRARVVVRDNYPRLEHQPPKQSEISRFTTTASGDDESPLELPLSSFVPRLFSVSISDVQIFVSAQHGTIPNLYLSINSELGGESAHAVKGQWTLSVNTEEVEDGMQATPSAAVEFDLAAVTAQCNEDEALTFRNIHFVPPLNVHEKEGLNKFHVSPAALKGSVDVVSGHVGYHLFSWIELHERWEVITRLGKGIAQMARLDAGLPPLLFKKLPISYVVNSVDVVVDEPKVVSSLYTIDTGGVPDEFQYHFRAFSIEGREEVVINPETRDRVVEINVHIQKVFISLKKASEMFLETYVTSANCELEIKCRQLSVKRCVKRKVNLAKSEVILHFDAKSIEFTERVYPIFERRLCQTEDVEFQHHNISLAPGGKYGEGVRLAKPVVDMDVKMGTLELEWSGRTHVSFFRFIKRFPHTIDNALGLPKDIHPSYLKQRLTVSRRLMVQVVPTSVSEGNISGRTDSGCIELQVETSGLDFSVNIQISEPSDVAPTFKNRINVNMDDVFVLMPPSQQLEVRRDAAVVNASSIASALGGDDIVNSALSNHHQAALGGKEQQQPNAFVPVLHMRDIKICQEHFDIDVKLDSLGCEISGKRKTNVSVTFSSIDVTLPPDIQFGDIMEDISKQFQIAEALIPERERSITVIASNTKYDFYDMTFICTDNQRHQDALALESHINKLEERSWKVAVDSSMSGKMKGGGKLAMALQRLEYEVHRDEPLESTQAFIRSLDSHDRPDTIVYQNIQGGQTRLMVSNYAAWVSGCSIPVVEFTSLCLTGALLQACLSIGPYSHSCYQLRLSTPPGHPFQNYPCNSGTSIKLDTMPQKDYMDVLLEIDGLELLYGRCLEPAIDLAGKTFSRLQSHSNSRRKEACIALCSSVKTKTTAAPPSLSSASPPRRSSFKTSKAPSALAAWDNLRCNVHGRMEMGISSSAFTYLLAPRSQAHNLNLFDSVRVISESANFTYQLGCFSLNLVRWVVSIPGVRNEAVQDTSRRKWSVNSDVEGEGPQPMGLVALQDSEDESGDGEGVVSPKLTKKHANAVYGPRHCAIFLPHVTIYITVVWDCRSGKPFWHHFSSDLDEIRHAKVQLEESAEGAEEDLTQPHNELKNLPLVQSCDDFKATGIHLHINLDTSSVSPMDDFEAIWFAIRMDTLERMSLMDDYYDVAGSPSLGNKPSRGETSPHVPAAEELDDDDDTVNSQRLVQSLNVKLVLQGLSMIAWRGVSRTSDGFLLSIQYFDACGISIGRSNDVLGGSYQPTYMEARAGGSTVDLVNVSSIFSDWEYSFDSKKLVPCYQSSEEANAWQLVSMLEKIDANERGQNVFSTTSVLFYKGKLTQTGFKAWNALNEEELNELSEMNGSPLLCREASKVSVLNFFHLLQEHKIPSSVYEAECYMRASMIVPSIAEDDYDELLEPKYKRSSKTKFSGGERMKNVKYSGTARAVMIIDQLRLLWTLPIRDGIVLLVGNILEQLASRRARLHRQMSFSSFCDSNSVDDYVVSNTGNETGSNNFTVKAKTTAAELPLEDIVHCVDVSYNEGVFNMLDWLEQRIENGETPISKVETDPLLERTPHAALSATATQTGSNQVDTCSSQTVNEIGVDTARISRVNTPVLNVEPCPCLSPERNSPRKCHARIVKDSVIDYEVQLIAPQVKLHGAKSSLILSVFRASAQSITLKTLISTNQSQHEEGQAIYTSQSRSFTQQQREEGGGQTENGLVDQSPTTFDECTSFCTALDGEQGTPSPSRTSAILTDLHEHELPAPSTSNSPSYQAPIVLRQKSINVKFQGARVYSLPEAAHGLSEWASEYKDEDVDVEAALNLSQHMGVLRKVMRRFNLTADYQFYEPMSIDEMRAVAETGTKLPLRHVDKHPCTKMFLDVPTLCLNVESEQLYQILDVVRNLLLAPPTQESLKRSQERSNKRKKNKPIVTVREQRAGTGGKMQLLTQNPNESSTPQSGAGTGSQNKTQKNKAGLQVVSRHDRQTMRSGVDNFLQAFQNGTLYSGGRTVTEAIRVEYYIGRCTCRLMMSPQYILSEGITDKVEVGMTGFGAKHSYMSVGNAAAVYQDVVMQVERFWINNLTPGPEACENFEDASSILGSVLPVQDKCQRCGLQFLPDQNRMKSCRFHGFEDGTQGSFALEKGYSALHWTCCGDPREDAFGCVTRPHVPKELMLCVRAEGFPPVLVEDMDIHVFKHVEVNMFPSAKYSLVLQLTSGVARMLQRYFELEEEKDGLEDENEIKPCGSLSPSDVGDMHNLIHHPPHDQQQQHSRNSKKKGKKDDEEGGEKKEKSSPDVIYVKYVRLGNINLVVSVQGFKYLSLDKYNVAVKPFVRWRKVGTGPQMLRKLIWHITRSVTTDVLKPNLFRAPAEDESKRKSFLSLPTLPTRKKTPKRQTDKAKPSTSSGNSKDSSGFKIKRMFRRQSN